MTQDKMVKTMGKASRQGAVRGRSELEGKAKGSQKARQHDAAAEGGTWGAEFRAWLEKRDRSDHSIRAYLSDVRLFAAWFTEHTGEPFVLEAIAERDVRDWRDYLELTSKPATVNRKLAALSMFYQWAGKAELVEHDPTAYVNGVDQQPVAPKALAK